MSSLFTLYFDGSFWVGVYEIHHCDGTVQAARHVFVSEPSNAELWAWTRSHGNELIDRAHTAPRIVPSIAMRVQRTSNPKKIARLAAREAEEPRTSTAAQQALARTREEKKTEKRAIRAQDREEQARVRYQRRVAKRRAKRRGR